MSKETLKDLVVTPEDIADGFSQANLYGEYLEVMRASGQGKTFVDLCGEKGFSRSCPSAGYDRLRGQFKEWVGHGRVPYSVRAILELQEMGFFPVSEGHGNILPFDYKNSRFPLANLLASCAFWRGSLNRHISHSGHDAFVNPKEELPSLRALINALIKGVGLSTERRKLRLDSFYGRFLRTLGVPTDKTLGNMVFPRPFELANNSLDIEGDPTLEEIHAARMAVRDFILAAFYMGRICNPQKGAYHLSIPSSSSPDITNERRVMLDAAFTNARLDIPRTACKRTVTDMSTGSDFVFPEMNQFDVDRLVAEFEGRIAQIMDTL